MTYFDKMREDIGNKDLNAIEKWVHPDFLFVADFEMLIREDCLRKLRKSSIEMKSHFMIMLNVLWRMST